MIMTRWIVHLTGKCVLDVHMSMGGEHVVMLWMDLVKRHYHKLNFVIILCSPCQWQIFCKAQFFVITGGLSFFPPTTLSYQNQRWHRHCLGIVILTAPLLKDMMSFAPWKTITKQFSQVCSYLFASLVVCFHLMVRTGGVQWKPSQLKSHHSCSI